MQGEYELYLISFQLHEEHAAILRSLLDEIWKQFAFPERQSSLER